MNRPKSLGGVDLLFQRSYKTPTLTLYPIVMCLSFTIFLAIFWMLCFPDKKEETFCQTSIVLYCIGQVSEMRKKRIACICFLAPPVRDQKKSTNFLLFLDCKIFYYQCRLEICQKFYTTRFFNQKFYTLKTHISGLFSRHMRKCVNMSYLVLFCVKIYLNV